MSPADGAGDKCVYVVECIEDNGRWALVYTSEEAAKQEKKDAGAYLTGSQECLLRSIIEITEIAGILFKSKSHSYRLPKQDIVDMLSEIKLRDEAWDAICVQRTVLWEELP